MSEDTRKCPGCERQIPAFLFKCDCGYPHLKLVACVVCKLPMPKRAARCNRCSAYQGRIRRHFGLSSTVLALLVALISVLSAALPQVAAYRKRHSNTVVTFLGADKDAMHIRVRNTGLSPSTLRGFRLRFDGLPIEETRLTLAHSEVPETRDYVPKEAETTMRLTASKLRSNLERAALEERIAAQQVTLIVEVQESDGPRDGPWPSRIVTFPANGIREFILAKVPEEQ